MRAALERFARGAPSGEVRAMPGVLLAVRRVQQLHGLTVGLEHLL